MSKQVTGSVRSRKKHKPLIDALIKRLIEHTLGEERGCVFRIEYAHFARRPEWLPSGKRVKLLDKSAIWEYNAVRMLNNAYEAGLTDTSYSDILKLKREFSLKEYEVALDNLLDIGEGV